MKKLLILLMFFPTFFIGQINDIDSLKIKYNNKGNLFARESKFYEAIIEYNKAIELDTNYFMGYINRGSAYAKSGKENKAIIDYNKVIEINPVVLDTCIKRNILPNVYFFRAEVFINQKKYKDAIADYNKAIELNPNYTDAYLGRGLSYSVLEKHNKAIADYNKVIELLPTNSSVYFYRGFSKEKSGLPYCSDYKRACYLGLEQACQWYNGQCR